MKNIILVIFIGGLFIGLYTLALILSILEKNTFYSLMENLEIPSTKEEEFYCFLHRKPYDIEVDEKDNPIKKIKQMNHTPTQAPPAPEDNLPDWYNGN